MIKVISVVHKKPDISKEDFYRYWKDVHGPLVAQALPGMKKYVQNHLIRVPGYEYEGNGLIETWYDDVNAFREDMAFTPGIAIMLVVFAFNMIGDGLRAALDPSLRGTL
jgi:uncharacterized protein (TIGR02118 family)